MNLYFVLYGIPRLLLFYLYNPLDLLILSVRARCYAVGDAQGVLGGPYYIYIES